MVRPRTPPGAPLALGAPRPPPASLAPRSPPRRLVPAARSRCLPTGLADRAPLLLAAPSAIPAARTEPPPWPRTTALAPEPSLFLASPPHQPSRPRDQRHPRHHPQAITAAAITAGYNRYEAADLDTDLVMDACVLPSDVPEADGADKMAPTLATYGEIKELAIDRAFLTSDLAERVRRAPEAKVICRAPPRATGSCTAKPSFLLI